MKLRNAAISLFLITSLFGCQEDGSIKVPKIVIEEPKPTPEEQLQKFYQELQNQNRCLLVVTNNSKQKVENITFWFKFPRRNNSGQMDEYAHFPSITVMPGQTVQLTPSADVYKKATCLKNGKIYKIGGEMQFQAGQAYNFPIN